MPLWLEVWTDDDGYLLVLKALDDGRFELHDPQTGKLDSEFTAYAAAEDNLREDEFHLVEGRLDVT